MNKIILYIICGVVCLGVLPACNTLGQYPDDNPVDPTMIDVDFSLTVDMSMESEAMLRTYTSMLNNDYDIRYVVDFYKGADNRSANPNGRVLRIVETDDNISEGEFKISKTIKLHALDYSVLVWVDFVRKGTETDLYYNTTDLRAVEIIREGDVYVGYRTTKDAFSTSARMDLTPYRDQRFAKHTQTVQPERPFGVYQIVTTDIDEYMSYNSALSYSVIRPSTTNFTYQSMIPSGYNVQHGVPDNFKAGFKYTFDIVETVPQSEAIVASDMVFIENTATYDVGFEIRSAEDKHINSVSPLRISLTRNKISVLRGEFLTKNVGNGDIGVDDGFDEEIVVPIN